jgi:hypothetical protein
VQFVAAASAARPGGTHGVPSFGLRHSFVIRHSSFGLRYSAFVDGSDKWKGGPVADRRLPTADSPFATRHSPLAVPTAAP